MRDGKWKLVMVKKKSQLFDLSTDISEKTDISKQHPEQVERLTKLVKAWSASVKASAAEITK